MNIKTMPKLFLGPMSLNLVKAVINLSTHSVPIGLIPSRRQIEFDGGYVNNWTTKDFSNFIKQKNSSIILQRDHGGAKQGKINDDGRESYRIDCESNFDLIHVDPWKNSTSIADAVEKTIQDLEFIHSCNDTIRFEIGTEQGIYPYSTEELDYFISSVYKELKFEIKNKISFLVIQTGTKTVSNENIGVYEPSKMIDMANICNKNNLYSKEHNGDYLSRYEIEDRFSKNLNGLNIAPELGLNESTYILNELKKKKLNSQIDDWYNLCIESGKWKKWIKYEKEKEEIEKIISITGHYTFSSDEFEKIKNSIGDHRIDEKITNHHMTKIKQLLSII
jgi:hypothetical protein